MSALPQSGHLWLDRYEIRAELGRGGFGRVYLGRDLRLDREVAIKVLRQSDELSSTDHQRFRREIAIAARLSHPNVVTVYDGGEHDGLSYLVMRYVEGDDLRSELKVGPLPLRRVVSVIAQVASALDYAHGLGLVHRDVKPGNILCEVNADRVYLADFGITRPVEQSTEEQLTQAGLGPATFYYAAPEQLRAHERVDARTDVYALGCVLYECLTAQRPFEGTIGAVIGAHLHELPPRASLLRRDLAPRWNQLVATAMAKAPEQRYARCSDLAGAVAELAPATSDATVSDDRALARTQARRTTPLPTPRRDDTPRTAGPPSPRPATPRHPPQRSPSRRRTRHATAVNRSDPARQPNPARSDPPPLRSTELRPARPQRRRTRRSTRVRRTVLLALAALVALVIWQQFGAALGLAGRGADGRDSATTEELDDEQIELLAALGAFSADDCRGVQREPFDGVRTAISCGDDQQSPTRVVYRRFDDEDARDAAFEQQSAGRPSTGDCRAGPNVRHPYRTEVGQGRVLCTVANGNAGVMWTVPGTPLSGNALLEDTDTLADLYIWWDDLVARRPGDRLPDCPTDDGLINRGAIAAVQCELSGDVATIASNAQFASVAEMDAWYDAVLANARERRLDAVRSGRGPRVCAGLGRGTRRWVGGEAPWSIDGGEGRLLCFTNESEQNALFWTDTSTAIGSVAVSPAADSRLGELVAEWARSPYRVAD